MDFLANEFNLVRQQYPGLDLVGWSVEMGTTRLTELKDSPETVSQNANKIRLSGCVHEESVEIALRKAVSDCNIPDGHIAMRLKKEGEKPMLVIVRLSP